MKKFIAGLLVGLLISTTAVFGAGVIKSAQYNANKVIFNGETLTLNQSLISVVEEGSNNASNYMPVRAVLEGMGYTVAWDGTQNAVVVDSPKSDIVPEEAKPSNDLQGSQQSNEGWLTLRELVNKYDVTASVADFKDSVIVEKDGIMIAQVSPVELPLSKRVNQLTYVNEVEFLKLYHAAGF